MATFTSVGDNVIQEVTESSIITISISGTYDMRIAFQREVGSPGSGVWETIKTYIEANATVSENFPHSANKREFYRLIVTEDTSGTATATLSAASVINPGAGSVWGAITGTLSNQTDLQTALNAKASTDDLGDLATLNTVAEAQVGIAAITTAKIGDGEVTKAKLASDVFETNAGIQTGTATDEAINAAGLKHALGLYRYINGIASAGNITEITSSHYGYTIDIDQNLTLDNAFGASLASDARVWVEIVNVDTSSHTVTVEAGAGGTGTINDTGSITIPAGGTVVITSISNAGDEPEARADGDTTEVDFEGKVVQGNLADVETDTGTLDVTQSGKIIVTSGNITIPTTAGFNCTLIAGGAHTVSFNSTTSAAMAAGDIMSIIVQSATVIHAVLTAAADKVSFS